MVGWSNGRRGAAPPARCNIEHLFLSRLLELLLAAMETLLLGRRRLEGDGEANGVDGEDGKTDDDGIV